MPLPYGYTQQDIGQQEDDDDAIKEALDLAKDYTPSDERPIFDSEDLKNSRELRSSQVAPYFTKDVIPNLSGSSGAYRASLAQWVNTHLSTDAMLANNSLRRIGGKSILRPVADPFEITKIKAELGLKKTRLAATKWDKKQTWWGLIEDNLLDAYDQIHSRTWGPERERMINLKKITSTETTVETRKNVKPAEQQKKKFKIF